MPILYSSRSRRPLPRCALLVFKVRLALIYFQLYGMQPISGKVGPGKTIEIQGTIYPLVFNVVGQLKCAQSDAPINERRTATECEM